jgi:PIN domain nuclease of toxin-antitoxin system
VKLLIDTHAVLWYLSGDGRLSRTARRHIEQSRRAKFLSIASVWEIAIKVSLRKLELDDPLAQVIDAGIADSGAALLAISRHHAVRVATLPWHHRDPFDRMLVAQALEDDLTLLSSDDTFDTYGVRRVW